VSWIDVWTSLGAKVGVLRNVSPEFGKGGKRQIKLLAMENLLMDRQNWMLELVYY
jgi:hypothetical protein